MATKAVGVGAIIRRSYTEYRLYIGDGKDNYIKFDGSSLILSSTQANAIIIKSGGNILLGDNPLGDQGIQLDSDPDSRSGSWSTMQVDVNGVGFACAFHLDTDGNWIQADNAGTTTMPCMALALETGTGSKEVLLYGFITKAGWTYSKGAILFASDTSGSLTEVVPTGSGDQIQSVGIAIAADTIFFNPNHVLVEYI